MLSWDEAKIYAGTLRGYRAWRIERNHNDAYGSPTGRILPLMFSGAIESSTLESDCKRFWIKHGMTYPHCLSAPQSECRCGLYAYYGEEELISDMENCGEIFWYVRIPGIIQASGKIILHQYGFRAEKATIKALCHYDSRVRLPLALTYPDVEIFKTMNEMTKAYPQEWSHQ